MRHLKAATLFYSPFVTSYHENGTGGTKTVYYRNETEGNNKTATSEFGGSCFEIMKKLERELGLVFDEIRVVSDFGMEDGLIGNVARGESVGLGEEVRTDRKRPQG